MITYHSASEHLIDFKEKYRRRRTGASGGPAIYTPAATDTLVFSQTTAPSARLIRTSTNTLTITSAAAPNARLTRNATDDLALTDAGYSTYGDLRLFALISDIAPTDGPSQVVAKINRYQGVDSSIDLTMNAANAGPLSGADGVLFYLIGESSYNFPVGDSTEQQYAIGVADWPERPTLVETTYLYIYIQGYSGASGTLDNLHPINVAFLEPPTFFENGNSGDGDNLDGKTLTTGSAAWDVLAGSLLYTDGLGIYPSSGGTHIALFPINNPNHLIVARLYVASETDFSIMFNIDMDNTSRYWHLKISKFDDVSGPGRLVELFHEDDGATLQAYTRYPFQSNIVYNIRLRIAGSGIQVFINGYSILTVLISGDRALACELGTGFKFGPDNQGTLLKEFYVTHFWHQLNSYNTDGVAEDVLNGRSTISSGNLYGSSQWTSNGLWREDLEVSGFGVSDTDFQFGYFNARNAWSVWVANFHTPSSMTNANFGVIFNGSETLGTYWLFRVMEDEVQLLYYDGEDLTSIDSTSISLASSSDYAVRVDVGGDTVICYVNDVEYITYSVGSRVNQEETKFGIFIDGADDTSTLFTSFAQYSYRNPPAAPAVSLPFVDEFNDTEETGIESHTPDTGGFLWDQVTGYWEIGDANQLRMLDTSTGSFEQQIAVVLATTTGQSDYEVETDVITQSGGNFQGGIMFRFLSLSSPDNFCMVGINNDDGTTCSVWYNNGDGRSQIVNSSISGSAGDTFNLRINCLADTLTVYVNDTLIHTITEFTPNQTETIVGLWMEIHDGWTLPVEFERFECREPVD